MPRTTKPIPPRPGLGGLHRRAAEILRVDHAGELAAVQIYRGQQAVFAAARGKASAAAGFREQGLQEEEHLKAFEGLLLERGVRPSALSPLWRAAGFALGAATALIGEEAAHACTEAVETVIEEHYADQAEELTQTDPQLAERLSRYRQDELAHRERAIEAGARRAPGHGLISAVIRAGCRAAIKAAEKL